MLDVLKEKWLWILILVLITIMVGSLLLIYLIIILPFPFNTILFITVIVLGGIAAGYKEWLRKEREKK